MAQIISEIQLTNLPNIPHDGRGELALAKLQYVAGGPADMRGMTRVVKIALKSVRLFLEVSAAKHEELIDFELGLEKANAAIEEAGIKDQPLIMSGQKTKCPIWQLLFETTEHCSDELLTALGAELCISVVLQRPFRTTVVQQIKTAKSKAIAKLAIGQIATRLKAAANEILTASAHQSIDEIEINLKVQATVSAQLNPDRVEERQAAGAGSALTQEEIKLCASLLKTGVEAGCALSLQIVFVYLLGLPWDIGIKVLFANHVKGEWVALIDVLAGNTKVDLEPSFPKMARGQSGHFIAVPVLVRPIPKFARNALVTLLSKSMEITCLEEISSRSAISRTLIPGADQDLQRRLTIAAFAASRGSAALSAGLDRDRAAYSSCDFTKIGKSRNSYICFSAKEIWTACSKTFEWLGWGEAVDLADEKNIGIGSRATPEASTIRAINDALAERVANAKAGKKYTLASLTAHTNEFATYCAHFVAFFESARLAITYQFLASDYPSGATFVRLKDKKCGPHGGLTPIPLANYLTSQIKLWRRHLELLDIRLEKLEIPPKHPLREYIHKILCNESVPLFFQFINGAIVPVGSSAIKRALPEELQIKLDDGRHFVPNALRREGIKSTWNHSNQRHHAEGISNASSSADIAQIIWLRAVADALDRIAFELGMNPIVGLGR